MFGLSFGELVVVIIVAIAVIGPKDLPRVLRSAGQWAGRLRRMASDLRVQSGIDEVLREGSMRQDIEEIRKLARGELDMLQRDIRIDAVRPPVNPLAPAIMAATPSSGASDVTIEREREFPRDGADTYGALPDTAIVYDGSFPASKWAKDEVYMIGVIFPEDAAVGAVPAVPAAAAAPAEHAAPPAVEQPAEGDPA